MSGMSENLAVQLSEEELREIPMVDLVHKILQSKGEPMLYRDLLQEVARLKGFRKKKPCAISPSCIRRSTLTAVLSVSAGACGD